MTEDGLIRSYSALCAGDQWTPSLNELVDLTDADLHEITPDGLGKLASMFQQIFTDAGVESCKTAVYSPEDLPFGLARMYENYAAESPETVHVFRDRDAAIEWLTG